MGREECKDKLVGNGQQSWRDYSRVKDVEDILNRQDEGGCDDSGCMVLEGSEIFSIGGLVEDQRYRKRKIFRGCQLL